MAESPLASDTVCKPSEETPLQIQTTMTEMKVVIQGMMNITGDKFVAVKKFFEENTPLPYGVNNFVFYAVKDRVVISARRDECSVGVVVMPLPIFLAMMRHIEGVPA